MLKHDGELVDSGLLGELTRAEIDTQIATAKQYPRDVKRFLDSAKALVTMDEDTAAECLFALKRGNKVIEGPSVRMAEILASTWGNCRAGARVINEDEQFVTAQGVFADLESNSVITYEVRRRIVDSQGRRYNIDMVAVTANAACSIALRNAIQRGIPKAIWQPIYNAARKAAIGDAKTLAAKRDQMLSYFSKMGIDADKITAFLNIKTVDAITLDDLGTLRGIATAIKDGELSVDNAFATDDKPPKKKARIKDEPENPSDGTWAWVRSIVIEKAKSCKTAADVKALQHDYETQAHTEEQFDELMEILGACKVTE